MSVLTEVFPNNFCRDCRNHGACSPGVAGPEFSEGVIVSFLLPMLWPGAATGAHGPGKGLYVDSLVLGKRELKIRAGTTLASIERILPHSALQGSGFPVESYTFSFEFELLKRS